MGKCSQKIIVNFLSLNFHGNSIFSISVDKFELEL